jgi:hypothetical protein
VCSSNQCVLPTCTSPEILCGTACVNPNTNAQHCGTCGNACGLGRTCSGGECTPKWVTIGASAALSARSHAASAYIPSQNRVFIWGGQGASGALGDGALYDVTTDTWSPVPTGPGAPSPRVLATAVWTGQVVVVWGGGNGSSDYTTGAMFDPSAGTWTAMATNGAPSARRAPYAVLTGSGVLFWGGFTAGGNPGDHAYLFDATANTWTAANGSNDAKPVLHPTVGWSGSGFYVFGGIPSATGKASEELYVYAPGPDQWSQLASAPNHRFGAFGGWDGSFLIAWGGRRQGGGPPAELSDGYRYDALNGWTTLSAPPAAMTARHGLHREVGWSARIAGGRMLMLGGINGSGVVQKDGAIYDSTTNTWSSVPAWPSGEERRFASGVWTGSEFVLWGGQNGATPSATGERFRP